VYSAYLSEIWIYPVKSLAGFRVPEAFAGAQGLRHDRQWMITDTLGNFLTQRKLPQMALLQACVVKEGLLLSQKDVPGDAILVPFSATIGPPLTLKVWDDFVPAHMPSMDANRWLSDKLGQDVFLVHMHPEADRTCRIPGHEPRALVFADDFPYHLVSQSSLDELNASLEEKVDSRRFRPNLVISGWQPFQEDSVDTITIGHAQFSFVSPCERCVMVNVNPETGQKTRQPLKTLAQMRRQGNNIIFGQNLIARREGLVAEGDWLKGIVIR